MSLLRIEHITKNYSNHRALDNVSMEVDKGSIFGLLGPNGAGKTSLIRIINQITAPDTGTIYINDEKLASRHISLIGYLPEERGLYKKMEVGEQVLYLAQLKGLSRKEAMSRLKVWFEKFEMKGWWKKKIEELSKGMQQKVQFIVTVIHEPPLLILDEPFTGFDPINANLIKDELLALRNKGCTIILSTHRMESVEELCTHIALINKSKKILDGSVKHIRRMYKTNTYKVMYAGNAISFANGLWTGYDLMDSKHEGDHLTATVRLKEGKTTNDLLSTILPHAAVLGFEEVIPSMNDIFIAKVNEVMEETVTEKISA